MGKRKVTILEPAVEGIAQTALFIEGKGLPMTAKRFVDDAFYFFDTLSDERSVHRPCKYLYWQILNYRCVSFRKKYVVAYLENADEIIICDFVQQKLLR